MTSTPVFEAKRWVEKAPAGGSRAQIFELRDGRYVVVKFPENAQGGRVLVNEFISCTLAGVYGLPVNQPVLVSIDGRLLKDPQARGECPPEFTAGIRCGMIRVSGGVVIDQGQLSGAVANADELHLIEVFDAFIARRDGRQLLAYPDSAHPNPGKRFTAIDYGFSFGGQPNWTAETVRALPMPTLPTTNPLTGQPYADGGLLRPIIEGLRKTDRKLLADTFAAMHPPRWDASPEELQELGTLLELRAQSLVAQFDTKYSPQMEIPK